MLIIINSINTIMCLNKSELLGFNSICEVNVVWLILVLILK